MNHTNRRIAGDEPLLMTAFDWFGVAVLVALALPGVVAGWCARLIHSVRRPA